MVVLIAGTYHVMHLFVWLLLLLAIEEASRGVAPAPVLLLLQLPVLPLLQMLLLLWVVGSQAAALAHGGVCALSWELLPVLLVVGVVVAL